MEIGDKVVVPFMGKIENQYNVGKCVAMAITAFIENEIYIKTGKVVDLSHDYIYANRDRNDSIHESLNIVQGLESVTRSGVPNKMYFSPHVKYPLILDSFHDIPDIIHEKASKLKFEFNTKILTGFDVLDQSLELLKEGHMLLTTLDELSHEVVCRGIEKIGEDLYIYTFLNSWGRDGMLTRQGDKQFLYHNQTMYPEILNLDILDEKPIVTMQLDNPRYTLNNNPYMFKGLRYGKTVYTPPIAIDGRTMIPLRAVLEGLGYKVEWVSDTKEILIYRNGSYMI